RDRARVASLSKSYDCDERGEHRGGAFGNGRGSYSDRRNVAKKFVFAGGSHCRGNLAPAERRSSVPGRGWIRRAVRPEHAEPAGSEGEPRDGRGGKAHGGCVRFEQIRKAKPVVDRAAAGIARSDYRSRCAEVGRQDAEESWDR